MRRASWLTVGLVWCCSLAWGQNQGNNQNQNNNAGGVLVDAAGVVSSGFTIEPSQRLQKQKQRALAAKALSTDLLTPSACRKVSLAQLAAELSARLEAGTAIGDELQNLAGLQRIDYIFIDREERDVILAGPAEPFAPDTAGLLRGTESGRPPLKLDDLLIALRYVPGQSQIGCSIDPVPERLAALDRFLKANSTPANPAAIEGRFRQMATTLGMQDIRVDGVPAESRFGRLLVAADYQMKRISMGLDDPGVKGLRSHLSLLKGGGNSIQRWWMVPLYDGLFCDDSRLAFEFTGPRVQLLSQEELSNAAGERSAAATTRISTEAFARSFTEHYPQLSDQLPIFAELQQLIDWCLVGALWQQERWSELLGSPAALLLDPQRLPTESGPAPRQTQSIANYKRVSSGMIVGLVGGGVVLRPHEVASRNRWQFDPARRLESVRQAQLSVPRPPAHRWWWDE